MNEIPNPENLESKEECFERHVRHYLAKSLIRLDELEVQIKYPNGFCDQLALIKELKEWNMQALCAAAKNTHTVPNL